MDLFGESNELLEKLPDVENKEAMYDFLQSKLNEKGFGEINSIVSAMPSVGTHRHPIFEGTFICDNGTAKVKCVFRNGNHERCENWAVYVRRV